MTSIEKPCRRLTRGALDGSYGPDRGRKLVVSLEPGDMVSIRPHGTRRAELVSLFDVYRFALRWKATRLAAMRQLRAEKRLVREARNDK